MMPDKGKCSHVWLLLLCLFIAASQSLFAPIESLENAVGQEQITTEVEGNSLQRNWTFPKQKLDTELPIEIIRKARADRLKPGFMVSETERIGFRLF